MKIITKPEHELLNFHGMLTVSPQMAQFFELLNRVARTDSTVLIRGETGTGKELVAAALHTMGPRKTGPFKALNCAVLNSDLLASELFGHVKGSFTGAIRDHKGLFELADKGTIFLDEVAEIDVDIQARLLRVLQERSFTPVGAMASKSVDVRVISATNRSLRKEVEEKRFREDLMYRVRVVPLFIPRLAERVGDIDALTWSFIEEFNQRDFRYVSGISKVAHEALNNYTWPGNVRELRNVIEFAFAIGDGPILTINEFTPELRGEGPKSKNADMIDMAAQERTRIVEALRVARGKKNVAADILEMSRSTLWRKMREFDIN